MASMTNCITASCFGKSYCMESWTAISHENLNPFYCKIIGKHCLFRIRLDVAYMASNLHCLADAYPFSFAFSTFFNFLKYFQHFGNQKSANHISLFSASFFISIHYTTQLPKIKFGGENYENNIALGDILISASLQSTYKRKYNQTPCWNNQTTCNSGYI